MRSEGEYDKYGFPINRSTDEDVARHQDEERYYSRYQSKIETQEARWTEYLEDNVGERPLERVAPPMWHLSPLILRLCPCNLWWVVAQLESRKGREASSRTYRCKPARTKCSTSLRGEGFPPSEGAS